MIIPNGTIEFVTNTPGGLDGNGYPVPASKSYGLPLECQYQAVTRNNIGITKNDEPFTQASYTVLIEWIDRSSEGVTGVVRLKSRSGNEIGEFPVRQIEPLEAVCQLRLYL